METISRLDRQQPGVSLQKDRSFKVSSQPNHCMILCTHNEQQVVGIAQFLQCPFGVCHTHRMWGQGWDLCQGWRISTKGRLASPLLSIHLTEEVTTGCLTQNSCCGRGSPIWGQSHPSEGFVEDLQAELWPWNLEASLPQQSLLLPS